MYGLWYTLGVTCKVWGVTLMLKWRWHLPPPHPPLSNKFLYILHKSRYNSLHRIITTRNCFKCSPCILPKAMLLAFACVAHAYDGKWDRSYSSQAAG